MLHTELARVTQRKNRSFVTDNLVEVSQKPAGVKEDHKLKNNKLFYYGLGMAGVIGMGFFAYSFLTGNKENPSVENNVNTLRR